MYFSQFISFFQFILSILYTILKFIVNLDFFFFVILLSIDGFFVLFPSFCIFLVFSDILPAEPSTGSSLRMPGNTIKKNLLSLPGNTSFRKHKRFFFFFFLFFLFFSFFSFFVLYSAFFFSFGIIIFSTIAATAAGTIPEPPKISWI